MAAQGVEKLDLLVVCDPHPTNWAVLGERKNGTYLLPACSQYETRGTRTASNGSLQAYQQIVPPLFESKSDGAILYLLAKKLGYADQIFKNIKVEDEQPFADDVLSEINRGGWSTGYSGQSPERLKAHLRNQAKFDPVTLRAPKDDPEVGGDYYGLPWPCWGTPELRHPGTPVLYNTNLHVMEGGGTFRARFGVERDVKLPDGTVRRDNLLAEGSLLRRLGDQGWVSRVYLRGAQEARLGQGPQTRGTCRHRTYRRRQPGCYLMVHRPVRRYPARGAGARMQSVRQCQGARHRMESARSRPGASRADLHGTAGAGREVSDLAERACSSACRIWASMCRRRRSRRVSAKQFPLILTSGRLVEYEGGGEESRSNAWLAELQQDMFIEINPADAAERGIENRMWVHVSGPEMPSGKVCRMKALVTPRITKGVTWCPFHFAGWFMNTDLRKKYPRGTDPIVLGESVNTITTYGYDPATGMQEPKATLCQVRRA